MGGNWKILRQIGTLLYRHIYTKDGEFMALTGPARRSANATTSMATKNECTWMTGTSTMMNSTTMNSLKVTKN